MTIVESRRGQRSESAPPARFDAVHGVVWLAEVPIPVRPGQWSNGQILEAIAGVLRELRGIADDAPCPLRANELSTFAELLDMDDRALRADIRRELALTKKQAGILVRELRIAKRAG